MFMMAAKEYHYNRPDRHPLQKTYYQIMLSVTLLMEGYYNVVDQFMNAIGTVENPNHERVFAEMIFFSSIQSQRETLGPST